MLSLVSEEGFECQNCGHILERTEDVKGVEGVERTGHEKNSKLMAQLDNMLKLLKQIDSVEIPPNDFETAWDHKVEIIRDQNTHPVRAAIPLPPRQQEIIRGTARTDATNIEVQLTSNAEKTAAEQAEEIERKAAIEAANALPVWHTQSTVNSTTGPQIKTESGVSIKAEDADNEQKPKVNDDDDNLAQFYAEFEREKELLAQQEASSAEEGSDEEDDEEFEEVGNSGPSGPATPGTGAAPTSAPTPSTVAGIKREHDTASSAPASSEVGTPSNPADDEPAMKKVKLESGVAEPGVKIEPDVKNEEESDEDEEEFEDV